MLIQPKRFEEWPVQVQRRLIRATLVDGSMRYCVRRKPATMTFVKFDDRGRVMGWLLVWPTRLGDTFATVFVNKRFRKQGVADELFDSAIAIRHPLTVLAWDQASRPLFDGVRDRHPGKLLIKEWKPFREKHGQLQDIGE